MSALLRDLFAPDGCADVPESAAAVSGSQRAELLHDALLRLGLVKDWRPVAPETLTKRDLVRATMHALGARSSTYADGFGKVDLLDIAIVLGLDPDERRDTNDHLRAAIADHGYVGIDDYAGGGYTRWQIACVAMAVIRVTHTEGSP